jgi:hypothetical protein
LSDGGADSSRRARHDGEFFCVHFVWFVNQSFFAG